jgi:hypothetical protein
MMIAAPPPNPQIELLGRLPAVDERDRRFAMAAPPSERRFRSWLSPGEVWDQGWTSQCVAYAANRWLTSHRVVNKVAMTHEGLYAECQRVDEWPGEDYDGTSVRAAFKVLKTRGFVQAYTWASELEPVVRHILEVGPVVMGTDWTSDMFDVDEKGYIWPSGSVVGGHAWVAIAVNRNRKNPDGSVGAVRLLNSWGAEWGQWGRAWVTLPDMERLIHGLEDWPGEACTAVEIDKS